MRLEKRKNEVEIKTAGFVPSKPSILKGVPQEERSKSSLSE